MTGNVPGKITTENVDTRKYLQKYNKNKARQTMDREKKKDSIPLDGV